MSPPLLGEVADRITKHLQLFAADSKVNAYDKAKMIFPYDSPYATQAGAKLRVKHKGYLSGELLSKREAIEYLAWLDAGGIGDPVAWRMSVTT